MAGSFVTPGTGDAAGKGRSSSLSVRFTVVTAVILQVGMLVIGEWVARRVVEGVVRSHAAAAALYTDSFLEVPLQELRSSATLSPESMQALDALLLPQAVRKPIVAFRIWKSDTVVYAEDRSVVGRSFPPSPMRTKAQSGDVAAAYRPPLGIEPANHFKSLQPLLEIYAPVRSIGTNEIVALAETYQLAPGLAADAEAVPRSTAPRARVLRSHRGRRRRAARADPAGRDFVSGQHVRHLGQRPRLRDCAEHA